MIEYEVRRRGSEHRVVVAGPCAGTPDDDAVSLALATDAAIVLSRAWACELTIWRVNDMAFREQDYAVPVATYDRGTRKKDS